MKKLILIIIAALTMSSCSMQRWCFRNFPPQASKDSIYITETTTIFRDTTVFIYVPADTVRVTDSVEVVSGLVQLPYRRIDVKHAWAFVQIENSRLQFELYQKEVELAKTIENAIKEATTTTTITVTETIPYPVPAELSWWQQTLIRGGYALLALIVAAGALFVIRKKLPP